MTNLFDPIVDSKLFLLTSSSELIQRRCSNKFVTLRNIARNIFGDLDLAVPMVSLESLVSADPDPILVASPYEGFLSSWSETWQRLNWQNRVRYVDASLVTRPGLRMLRGIESMCKSIGQPD